MRRTPKFWHRLAWSASILSVVMVIIWVGSAWVSFQLGIPNGPTLALAGGTLGLDLDGGLASMIPRGFVHNQMGWEWNLWGLFMMGRPSVFFPAWAVVVALLALAGVSWPLHNRSFRAARDGFCPACRYNRAGLPVMAPCPECGKAVAVAK